MPNPQEPADVRAARRKQIGFAGFAGVIFVAVLVYGLRPKAPSVLSGAPGLTQVSGPGTVVREDSPIPSCRAPEAIDAVKGALVRSQPIRVTGLSNIEQVAGDAAGNRSCRAAVDLETGTRTVSYTIRPIGPGRRTWELALTGR